MTANFLSKPVNRVELLARVKNMLAMRKSQLA
jgi:putative two-component system response regulator